MSLSEKLREVIKLHSTEGDEKFKGFLSGLSTDELISTFRELLELYMNDKNSSKLRELLTIWLAGYEPLLEKLGYNGYRRELKGEERYCEVKPQNINRSGKEKLNGKGNFSDYTEERLKKDLKKNPHILVSGFVDGKLVYILEFPFRCLEEKLGKQLKQKFPEGRREPGQYLRSARFKFKDYKDCEELEVKWINKELEKFKDFISKELYEFLEEKRSN